MMKANSFKNAVLATAIAAALTANQATLANETDEDLRAGTGFGLGALIGALAGPVGMVLGATTGTMIMEHEMSEEKLAAAEAERISAEAELVESQSAMAKLQETLVASNGADTLPGGGLEARHYSLEVLFRTASDAVEPKFHDKLTGLAALLGEHPGLRVELEGHADSRGDAAYNQALSEQRVEAVKQTLVDQGIDAARIHAKAYGESRSAAAANDLDGWALERRVSVSITNPKAAQGVAELKL